MTNEEMFDEKMNRALTTLVDFSQGDPCQPEKPVL